MRHIGKIGILNRYARNQIAEQAESLNLTQCELKMPGCKGTFGIAPAHKHPREWYRKIPELLYHRSQWRAACQWCHSILDDRSKTSKAESDKYFEQDQYEPAKRSSKTLSDELYQDSEGL